VLSIERVNWIFTMVGETDTRKATYAIQVACQAWSKSHERGHVKLARAASSHHPARCKVHITRDNKSINAHKTIVFYSCNQSMHRHGSDTTVGIRSIENKKFPTARTNNKPRSNLVDGSNEMKMRLTLEDFQSLRD
jgi:hypothetical protein